MYVHIGASITTVNKDERQAIRKRRRVITRVLDRLGHEYATNLVGVEHPIVPATFMAEVTDSKLDTIRYLRPDGNAGYTLREEVGAYLWGIDELERSGGCIFDLTRSSTGTGIEVILALQLGKPCLVVYDRPTISTMLNGMLNRLLVVRKWGDDIESQIEEFMRKADSGKDRTINFRVGESTASWLPNAAEQRGFRSVSDYLRFLVDEDRTRLNGD